MAQSIEIEITNISQFGGAVKIAVFSNKSEWLKSPLTTSSINTDKDSAIATFDLPYGEYAISVFQDVNANGELDTNFMGIPKEPIAFGNNYKPFGKPKFKSAAMHFSANQNKQTLELYKIL